MLDKFGNITKKVTPILSLMKEETANVLNSIQTGNVTELGNTVERLGLLTSRLYSEYLTSQNAFSDNPNLLNEALNVLTASQQAAMEAQAVLNRGYAGSESTNSSQPQGGDTSTNDSNPPANQEEPFLIVAERRVTLFAAVGVPALMFYLSKDLPSWKQTVVKAGALVGGLVAFRYYTKQR